MASAIGLASALSVTTGCGGPSNETPNGEEDAAGDVAEAAVRPDSGGCYFAHPSREDAGTDGGVRSAVAVSVGQGSACALTAAQDVECWGRNDGGELGNGSMTDSPVPVRVMGLDDCIAGVSVGGDSACAYISGGGVRCWGSNQYGQLGNGSTTSSPVPVQVTGITTGAAGVSVGDGFACALILRAQGDLYVVQCWGRNDRGQLGNGVDDQQRHAGHSQGAQRANRPVPERGVRGRQLRLRRVVGRHGPLLG